MSESPSRTFDISSCLCSGGGTESAVDRAVLGTNLLTSPSLPPRLFVLNRSYCELKLARDEQSPCPDRLLSRRVGSLVVQGG